MPSIQQQISRRSVQANLTSKLLALLSKFEDLFNGTLGKWNKAPVKLELKADATLYHARPFPIPMCHAEMLKIEVD
jgi:hypothetical protein